MNVIATYFLGVLFGFTFVKCCDVQTSTIGYFIIGMMSYTFMDWLVDFIRKLIIHLNWKR